MTEEKDPTMNDDDKAEPAKAPTKPKTNKIMDEAQDAAATEGSPTYAAEQAAAEQAAADKAQEAAAAAPKPKVPKKGVYVLEEGDSPGSVSRKLYGRGHMAAPLVRANPTVLWDTGDEISLP